ncbi:MAG: hypothetical protein ACK4K9_11050 [Bacteroidia bacterium]
MLRAIICIFFIFFLFEPTTNLAQTIEWSNAQKIKPKTLYTQILGENTSGIYLLRCRDTEFETGLTIEKYKSNLTLEISQNLTLSINGLVERVLLIENNIYAFLTAKNNTSGNIDVLVQKIDEYLKPVGLPAVLGSIPNENYIDKRHIQIKTSSNKNYISLMFLTKSQNIGILNLWTFDRQLSQIYAKQFNLNRFYKDIFITNYEVTNNAETFVLVDFPKEGAEKKKTDPRDFFVYGYNPLTNRMLQYAINDENIFIEDLTIAINNFNGTTNVFGTYAQPGVKGLSGYFFLRINSSSGLLENKTFTAIEYSTFFKNFTGKLGEKSQDLSDFYVRKIIPRSDGGIIALIEKYYQTRQVYTYFVGNFPQTTTRTIYHYDEAPVLNINPDGTLKQVNWIKKNQTSANDGGYLLSYIAIPTTDNLYFIYNVDNVSENDIMLSSLSYNGDFDSRILLKNANVNAAIIPSEYKQVSAKSALICAIKDKRFALMRITF